MVAGVGVSEAGSADGDGAGADSSRSPALNHATYTRSHHSPLCVHQNLSRIKKEGGIENYYDTILISE